MRAMRFFLEESGICVTWVAVIDLTNEDSSSDDKEL